MSLAFQGIVLHTVWTGRPSPHPTHTADLRLRREGSYYRVGCYFAILLKTCSYLSVQTLVYFAKGVCGNYKSSPFGYPTFHVASSLYPQWGLHAI